MLQLYTVRFLNNRIVSFTAFTIFAKPLFGVEANVVKIKPRRDTNRLTVILWSQRESSWFFSFKELSMLKSCSQKFDQEPGVGPFYPHFSVIGPRWTYDANFILITHSCLGAREYMGSPAGEFGFHLLSEALAHRWMKS